MENEYYVIDFNLTAHKGNRDSEKSPGLNRMFGKNINELKKHMIFAVCSFLDSVEKNSLDNKLVYSQEDQHICPPATGILKEIQDECYRNHGGTTEIKTATLPTFD